ncbi:MAG: YraN family protein [Planctomycetota bacterium]
MSEAPHVRGRAAEAAARSALAAAGFTIIESNFRVRGAELDVICRDDEGLAFVEVRARQDGDVEPSATIWPPKFRALLRGARAWLARHGQGHAEWRFLVVAVLLSPEGRPISTEIIEDPFAHLPEFHRGDP